MSIIRSPEVPKLLATLAIAVVIAALALSCAPASNEGAMDMAGMDMAGMAPGEGAVDLKIGETTPPFAMILSDGTEASSADLAASGRPAHLFWFATW